MRMFVGHTYGPMILEDFGGADWFDVPWPEKMLGGGHR